MKLREIIPEIIVKDISTSIEFYRDNLAFNVDLTAPETTPYTWCQLSLNNINIMLQEHKTTLEEIDNFPEVLSSSNILLLKYDSVLGTKTLYNTLKNKGIQFFSELRETEYGTVEFGIVDPDNYMILISAEEE